MLPKRKYEYVIIRYDNEIGLNEYGFNYLIQLEEENQELKDNWNTLKEWCTERYDYMTFKMEELENRWNK